MKKDKNVKDQVQDELVENKETTTETEEIVQQEEYIFERFLDVDIKTGLSEDVVSARAEHGYNNVVEATSGKTIGKIFRDNLLTFFNLLYLVITVLLIIAESWSNLTYLPVIIANTVIGIVQQIKAKLMIDKLSLVSAPKATVIRDGETKEIPTTDIVIDDIVSFTSGEQIYTDSIVRKGEVDVNEAMITGEADAVHKKPGDTLYSGSFIISGSCIARVDKVGEDNYIEKLASEARKHKRPKSELLRTLTAIIKIVAIIIIPLGLLTFFQAWNAFNITSDTTALDQYTAAINKTAAVVIGMIPAGLFLLTSIALAVSVVKLGKDNILVQELYCIEMLARVDVLCLDKTGTITDGTMRVLDCVEVKNTTDYTLREIVGSMMNAFEDSNPTSEALIRYFDKNKVLKGIDLLPFSSARKYSAVTFEDTNTNKNIGSFYLGAPEFVLMDQYDKVKSKVERFASEGCRVLVLGHATGEIKENRSSKAVKPIALIVIQDHIREDAEETINYFKNNGVDIKVISGDNPLTVSEIANRAGIDNANRFISLEGLNDDEVRAIALEYTVFGRVSPEQKQILVKALKAEGKTVAMTGDGVNDILALKEADTSIAMASGSEAVRYVAHLVLLDSNFSSMPKVVAEGRRVINNIQRTSTLFLVKTIFTILLTIMYLLLGYFTTSQITTYPFEPSQLILIETFVIGIPGIFLALQHNTEKVKGKFIANVMKRTLPGALTIVAFHALLFVLQYHVFGWSESDYSTIALLLTTAIAFMVLFQVSQPFNWWKKLIFISMLGISLAGVIFVGDGQILKLTMPSRESILLLLLLIQSAYPVMQLVDKFFVKIGLSKE